MRSGVKYNLKLINGGFGSERMGRIRVVGYASRGWYMRPEGGTCACRGTCACSSKLENTREKIWSGAARDRNALVSSSEVHHMLRKYQLPTSRTKGVEGDSVDLRIVGS
jgi:hypothetical protein